MEITHWDEKYIYMLHRFIVKGRVVAKGAFEQPRRNSVNH